MNEVIDPNTSGVAPQFSVIFPRPFKLSEQDATHVRKIKIEDMEKVTYWENQFSGFFLEYDEYASSYRMLERKTKQKKPDGLFNSRTGETNRAVNTLASFWLRATTADDPYTEIRALGYDQNGQEISEDILFGTEALIHTQLQHLRFKPELLKAYRSLATFGTVACEENWIRKRMGNVMGSIEGTGFTQRSLLQFFYDPQIYDIEQSDYVGTIDFLSENKIRSLAYSSDGWDKELTESALGERSTTKSTYEGTRVWSNIMNRRQRAGYLISDHRANEIIRYHGRINTENPVVQALWAEVGNGEDPRFIDFTRVYVNGELVSIYVTPYGTWHSQFKTANYNQFELESHGYGVGKTGRKQQRELDVVQSRVNDLMIMAALNMWKLGKYAGVNINQLGIKPLGTVVLEDINQLEPLIPNIQAIPFILQMMGIGKEDFRTTTGASTNLQAAITKATATEASLTQNEAVRGASVAAEIIAETLVREHIETMHLNNLNLLDDGIWVTVAGSSRPMKLSKYDIPANLGFKVKVTTDKDYKPELVQKLLQALQIVTSIRQMMPESINAVRPLVEKLFRSIGINPRLLNNPIPMADQMSMALQRAQKTNGGLHFETAGEIAGAADHQDNNFVQTPMGQIPGSPMTSQMVQSA